MCVYVCVCWGEGGQKKPLSLTPDDISGSTSKAEHGERENRGVQATDQAPLPLAVLAKKIHELP